MPGMGDFIILLWERYSQRYGGHIWLLHEVTSSIKKVNIGIFAYFGGHIEFLQKIIDFKLFKPSNHDVNSSVTKPYCYLLLAPPKALYYMRLVYLCKDIWTWLWQTSRELLIEILMNTKRV